MGRTAERYAENAFLVYTSRAFMLVCRMRCDLVFGGKNIGVGGSVLRCR